MKKYRILIEYISVISLIFIPGLVLPVYNQVQNFLIQQNDCFLKNTEKVYVQLEKNIFISGESLKFKAYVVNSSTLKKSSQSKVLYFEISGNNNKPVFSWCSNLNKGLGFGSVIIPDTVSGGIYTLRAYTNWMRNNSPAFDYSTSIIITKIGESDLKQLMVPNLSSFNRIDLQSLSFRKKYGYELNVENTQSDKLFVNISSKSEYIIYNELFHLITVLRGQIINDIPVALNDSIVKVTISKSNISAGILNVVLLDPYYNPVIEKPVYISPQNYPSLKINTSKTIYGRSDKVKLEIELNNLERHDTAWLSISVSEKTPFQSLTNNAGILSHLLLYSEISSYADFPDLSLTITEQSANNILQSINPDEYIWHMTSDKNNKPCSYIMENKGFVLNGKVLYRNSGDPVKNELVMLSYSDSIASLKYCYTDSGGNFYFLLDQSYDNRNLILQLINYNTRINNILWEIDKKYSSGLTTNYKPLPLPSDIGNYLEYCRKIALVNNVYQLNKQDTNLSGIAPTISSIRNFCGKPDYEVYPADFIELIDFRDISENILPGVRFRKKGEIYFIQIYDPKNKIIMPPEATVLLNGVPINDLNYISSLGSKDIKRIDIYNTQVLYGKLTFYGLLSIHTYDGKIPESYLENYTYVYKNEVLPSVPVSNYYIETQLNNQIINKPDFRQTLYWEPWLTITGQNKIIIEFYTSELKAEYEIALQGLTSGGFPLEATSEIKVK